ncbi:MAG: hypothetical protein FWF55_09690 [Treponema sp.]|nr:hypothetical protein [Treponema sp.]
MSRLIPVKYHKLNYPFHIETNICEIAGNFDIEKISTNTHYSLHTEYSFGARAFCSNVLKHLDNITSAKKNNIPQLWFNREWAKDFFIFIELLIGSNKPPEVLEIHPPFNDYCTSFDQFLNIFRVFYDIFKSRFPATTIVIENRFGTMNKEGKFLLSTSSDVLKFGEILSNSDIDLKIVLDYPQIFSAIINEDKEIGMDNLEGAMEKIESFNEELKKHREVIGGFHMWGKLKKGNRWIPHAGNFDTFFSNNDDLKHEFLSSVFSTFNDGIDRFFVPEVNSGQDDLHSIVADMEKEGFIFISKWCKLKKIKQEFDSMFSHWGIKLPEYKLENRESGLIEKSWRIQFCFGKKGGKEYMDCYCQHRMTNDRHMRFYEDGTGENLPAYPAFGYMSNPDDPDDKKNEEEYKKKINEVKKLLSEKGFF